ncbi:hypothetical protein B9Q13_00220 [Candidatus Marsarchaeota G2 archaeon ECH_B_SAG-G16]|uniref:CBS domain-containing protein n=1 Tax=Candidatus Marsarchaeota G2 archaeon ECH_B_SAG-G16 TaxID=1978167 RepID=A0A2R6C4T2_9ARCH|nr:MAG: hypothetical protein B9Q13_00220 [Candidatus Marsarchaeota G2 archaeon ECH_B_SAG-G16]
MSIQEIMTKGVVTAPESSSLLQLRARLLELRISRIVITNNEGKTVGIVSVKDLLRYALQDTSGRELSEVKANEIMSRPLITVTPSTSLKEASKKMIQKRVSSLVVMENERVVG